MNGVQAEPQYGRRVILRAFQEKVIRKKGKFTILGIHMPRRATQFKGIWQQALKFSLRTFRRREGVDYVILFETSFKGYEHAHVLLTRKTGKVTFSRANYSDVQTLRTLFFEKLRKLSKKDVSDLDQKRVIKIIKVFRTPETNELKPAGHGPGFLGYLLAKRELIEQGTVVSFGLLKLRKGVK